MKNSNFSRRKFIKGAFGTGLLVAGSCSSPRNYCRLEPWGPDKFCIVAERPGCGGNRHGQYGGCGFKP